MQYAKVLVLIVSASLLLVVAGCGRSSPALQPTHTKIVLYAALTKANGRLLAKDFGQTDPHITLSVVTGGTGLLLSRIRAEHQAGDVHADVLLLADPTAMAGLRQEHVLSSYTPPGAAGLPEGLRGRDWVGAFTFNNVIIYHPGMYLPIPTSWRSLASPVYRGKVELGNPAYSGTTLGMAGYLSGKYGWNYFQALRNNGATMVDSTNTVGVDVAAGRASVGISLDVVARNLAAKGSPIAIVWPKGGAIPVPAPVSIVAGHDTPAARQFVQWLLSPAGQKTLTDLGYVPVLGPSSMVPPHTKMAQVKWSTVETERTAILQKMQALFITP